MTLVQVRGQGDCRNEDFYNFSSNLSAIHDFPLQAGWSLNISKGSECPSFLSRSACQSKPLVTSSEILTLIDSVKHLEFVDDGNSRWSYHIAITGTTIGNQKALTLREETVPFGSLPCNPIFFVFLLLFTFGFLSFLKKDIKIILRK